jgi:hypothetical protein
MSATGFTHREAASVRASLPMSWHGVTAARLRGLQRRRGRKAVEKE